MEEDEDDGLVYFESEDEEDEEELELEEGVELKKLFDSGAMEDGGCRKTSSRVDFKERSSSTSRCNPEKEIII
jgi:hypothetical protein